MFTVLRSTVGDIIHPCGCVDPVLEIEGCRLSVVARLAGVRRGQADVAPAGPRLQRARRAVAEPPRVPGPLRGAAVLRPQRDSELEGDGARLPAQVISARKPDPAGTETLLL